MKEHNRRCSGLLRLGAALFLVLAFAGACQAGARLPGPVSNATAVPLAGSTDTPATPSVVAPSPQTRRASPAIPTATPVSGAAPLAAHGARPTILLRSRPQLGAEIIGTLPGSEVVWPVQRDAGGLWYKVQYGESRAEAWVAATELAIDGDVASLPVTGSSPGPAPATAPAAEPPAPLAANGRVATPALNVRAGPGTGYPVRGAVHAGDELAVTGVDKTGGWLEISFGGAPGWVARQFVELSGNANDLPVREPAAPPATQATPAAGPAPASSTAATGTIAFETRSGGDIYVMRAGSGPKRVTGGLDPALAPDGTRLAFTRWNESEGLYLLDLQTGQEERLSEAVRPRGPAWSSDGDKIVYSSVFEIRQCRELPFGCLDDGQTARIFRGQSCIPTPAGRICWADYPLKNYDVNSLYEVELKTGLVTQLPSESPAQTPAYRPGSNEVVYRGPNGLQVTASGGSIAPLTTEYRQGNAAWSPDGQNLVIQQYVHDRYDLMLLDARGATVRALTRPEPLAQKPVNNVAPAWSPDGHSLAFLSDRDGSWRLYRMDVTTGAVTPFLEGALKGIGFAYDFAAERIVTWSR